MSESYFSIPDRATCVLKRCGGEIERSEQFPRGFVHLGDTKVCDADIADLIFTPGPVGLDLSRTDITDVGADSAGEMTDLEYLSLYQTKITDRGLISLGNLFNLSSLELGTNPG